MSEFKPSMNELNRFLGGNTSTGKLGEWNLESIVRDVLPANTYEFQAQINPETTEKADCAVTNSEGLIIPIDSKFYQGQYQNYHEAGSKTEKLPVLVKGNEGKMYQNMGQGRQPGSWGKIH